MIWTLDYSLSLPHVWRVMDTYVYYIYKHIIYKILHVHFNFTLFSILFVQIIKRKRKKTRDGTYKVAHV